jgi:hypothetical protein
VNAQLESFQDQLISIRQPVPGLVASLSDAQFRWSPDGKRWSMAHCFDHLNVTAREAVSNIDAALAKARARGLTAPGPFVYPLLERLFVSSMEPPVRLRMRAPKKLRPAPDKPKADIVGEFMQWQDRLEERIRQADGIDLRRARSRSPASDLITWSLGTLFASTLAHERRHLWQARQVRLAIEELSASSAHSAPAPARSPGR